MSPRNDRAPRHALRRLALAALLLACVAPAAGAQNDTTMTHERPDAPSGTRHAVSVVTGYQWFDEATALYGAPILGLRIARPVGTPFLTAGINVAFSRPSTRGEMFPWNRQVYFSNATGARDTTLVFIVSQDVVLATYGGEIGARLPLGRAGLRAGRIGGIELEGQAGLGFSTIWADPEQNRRNVVIGGWYWQVGGGVAVPIGARGSMLRLRVDDVVLRNHDRDRLSLSDPLFSDDLFSNPAVTPPPEKGSYHNPRLSVAFTFIPGKVQ